MLNLKKMTTTMELYEFENSREYQAAKQLEEALNDYGFDYRKFTEAIRFMHPTLQQNLYRLTRNEVEHEYWGIDRLELIRTQKL